MADTKTTKTAATKKSATAKKAPAAKAATTAKPVALKSKATPAKKELTTGIRVTQIGSGIGRGAKQNATLRGLGLGKMHKSRILLDTPANRGMANKISHLVKMEVIG